MRCALSFCAHGRAARFDFSLQTAKIISDVDFPRCALVRMKNRGATDGSRRGRMIQNCAAVSYFDGGGVTTVVPPSPERMVVPSGLTTVVSFGGGGTAGWAG